MIFVLCAAQGLDAFMKCSKHVCAREYCYEKNKNLRHDNLVVESTQLVNISSINIKRYYKYVLNNEAIVDVTSDVMNDRDIENEVKENIEINKRKIMVFSYMSGDLLVPGFISYVPKDNADLIVLLRGGNARFGVMSPAAFSGFDRNTIVGTLYRGVGAGKDEFGGREVEDVNNLINYIPSLEKHLNQKLSNHKKYIIGISRGGMEMFRVLADFPALQYYFDKSICLSGLVDLEQSAKERPEMLDMFKYKFGLTDKNSKKWFNRRSVKYYINKIRKNFPILILQGTRDNRVSIKQGAELYYLMKAQGHAVDYWEIKEAEHGLYDCNDLYELLKTWLQR